jgi:hypothetical protein
VGVTPVRDRFPLQIEGHGQSDTQSRLPAFSAQTKLPIMQSFVAYYVRLSLTPHDPIRWTEMLGLICFFFCALLSLSLSNAHIKWFGPDSNFGLISVKAQLKVAQLMYRGPVVSPFDWWAQSSYRLRARNWRGLLVGAALCSIRIQIKNQIGNKQNQRAEESKKEVEKNQVSS